MKVSELEQLIESIVSEEVKKVIAKSKSIETMKSWHPEVYEWLVKNDKLDLVKHLPKRSTAKD